MHVSTIRIIRCLKYKLHGNTQQGRTKDTIYTKLDLMPWIDDNLGHTLSGLTQIGNIIAKLF